MLYILFHFRATTLFKCRRHPQLIEEDFHEKENK